MKSLLSRDERGFSLAVVLFVIVILAALATALSTITLATRRVSSMEVSIDRSAYIARAGFERTAAEILMNADAWDTLSTSPYTDVPFSDGRYTVTISDRSADGCDVTVNGTHQGYEHELVFTCERQTGAGMTYSPSESGTETAPPVGYAPGGGGSSKFTICHSPGTPQEQDMTVNASAWSGHYGHGDHPGPCGDEPDGWEEDGDTFVMCEDAGLPTQQEHYVNADMAAWAESQGYVYGVCPTEEEEAAAPTTGVRVVSIQDPTVVTLAR